MRGELVLPCLFLGLLWAAKVGVCALPNVLFILADDMGQWAARLASVLARTRVAGLHIQG